MATFLSPMSAPAAYVSRVLKMFTIVFFMIQCRLCRPVISPLLKYFFPVSERHWIVFCIHFSVIDFFVTSVLSSDFINVRFDGSSIFAGVIMEARPVRNMIGIVI